MAMMKIKNEAGEWVPIAPTNFMHQFKFAFVSDFKADGDDYSRSLDLSPYVQSNSDFMLIMKPTVSENAGKFQVYIHSDGNPRQFSEYQGMGIDISTLDFVFPKSSQCSYTYDEETRIFTYDYKNGSINNALLIYAG